MCKPPVVVDIFTLRHDGERDIKLQLKGGKISFTGDILC